ncbi:S24 family peptidase [Dongia sp.]|uniref:S24 family peptidase n=1 Tax=Dongia sp. TaxID=1977262 RepID=UPI003750594C
MIRKLLAMTPIEIKAALERHRVTQTRLAQAAGIEVDKLNKVLAGRRRLQLDENARIEAFFRPLDGGEAYSTGLAEDHLPASNLRAAPLPPRPDRQSKIPLLGSGQAGPDGVFELNNGEPIDYVDRPPGLAGKARIYCIYVDGDSMEPAHLHGDLLFVDAARKPFPGRDAVVELLPDNDGAPARAFIKRIVKLTPEFVELFEFRPKERTFRLARSKIRNLHLVLKNTDMY